MIVIEQEIGIVGEHEVITRRELQRFLELGIGAVDLSKSFRGIRHQAMRPGLQWWGFVGFLLQQCADNLQRALRVAVHDGPRADAACRDQTIHSAKNIHAVTMGFIHVALYQRNRCKCQPRLRVVLIMMKNGLQDLPRFPELMAALQDRGQHN